MLSVAMMPLNVTAADVFVLPAEIAKVAVAIAPFDNVLVSRPKRMQVVELVALEHDTVF